MRMNILITNDDGIYAPGLWALYNRFRGSHQVTVVAPDRERSGVGHGITLNLPLRATRVCINGFGEGYAVDGKPADCIKLGLVELMDERPDLVVSGINPGANVGISINYSGTVAAAKEAALFGLPAMAVSINGFDIHSYDDAADIAASIARRIPELSLPFGTLLNVNIPNIPLEKVRGIRLTRQGVDVLSGEYYEKRVDPRNRAYHWLGSDTRIFGEDLSIDGDALCNDYVTVTPLRCDATDYAVLDSLGTFALPARDD